MSRQREISEEDMAKIFSEFDKKCKQLLEKLDDEECFGFHSEYYIDPEWRSYDRSTSPDDESIIRKGYARYSKYKDHIYFIPRGDNEGYIIEANVEHKTSRAIKLDSKRIFRDREEYIAVNRQGYFVYNPRMVTLFGFDGHEISTHKFGQKDYVECVYIYDDKVIYSETKIAGISTQIYCINMLTKEKKLVWETQKGDGVFDHLFRKSYVMEWEAELPYFPNPSNIGNVSCEFLYANKHRVIAGYTRTNGYNNISYIINIDLTKNQWSILDCFAIGDRKYHLPPENTRHIFSFHMLQDSMWVKMNGETIMLVTTDIQQVIQLRETYPIKWRLAPLRGGLEGGAANYYYFDGVRALAPKMMGLYNSNAEENGKRIYYHDYQTLEFWYADDIFVIPDQYMDVSFQHIENPYSSLYSLEKSEIEELIQNTKLPEQKAEIETETCAVVDTKSKEEQMPSDAGLNNASTKEVSLVDFRQNAPHAVGIREELLAYRKSLPNSWDYNAYVGILLGVGGPKHGDAACMNFAIGQGDNGNNTRKTLEARGLMPVFEKYKGKKIDASVMLSNVEDEIISVVPEYMQIRQKIHSVMEV